MTPRPASHPRLLLPLIVLSSLLLPAAAAVAPRAGQPVAVFSWSATDGGAAAIAARSQGELRAAGASNRIVIASSSAPDFVARLYGAGAMLVIDATLAAACFPFLSSSRRGLPP